MCCFLRWKRVEWLVLCISLLACVRKMLGFCEHQHRLLFTRDCMRKWRQTARPLRTCRSGQAMVVECHSRLNPGTPCMWAGGDGRVLGVWVGFG